MYDSSTKYSRPMPPLVSECLVESKESAGLGRDARAGRGARPIDGLGHATWSSIVAVYRARMPSL